MASEEKTNICRVCLRTDTKMKKCTSLFEKYKDTLISDSINLIANVSIKRGDGLPTKICPNCLLELENALNFKKKCETSNSILQNSTINKYTELSTVEYNLNLVKKEENEQRFSDGDYGLEVDDYSLTKSEDDWNTDVKTEKCVVKSRAKDLKLICDDCGGSFKSKCKLRVHWKKEHLAQALICSVCKMAFKSYKAFHRHQKNRHKSCISTINMKIEGIGKSRVFHCKNCNYSTARVKDMQSHLVVHNGERPYICAICGKGFTQQSSLQAHNEFSHKIYIVETTCEYCGKLLRGRNVVYKHMKRHNEERFQCDTCKKFLKSKSSLKLHLVRHTGIKSYTCEKCASTFFTTAELSNHKRMTHNRGQYVYQCDRCKYKTYRSDTLKKHKARHTSTNMACIVCGMFLENAVKLANHQKRHFEEKKYACPHCESKYVNKDSLHRHIRAKHNCTMLVNKPSTVKEKTSKYHLMVKKMACNGHSDVNIVC
ncbi:zinc finger Y-chromosomal protein 2-like [Aphomia sociella]